MTRGTDEALSRIASVRRYMLAGTAVIALLIGGVGVWAVQTEIAGAVIANGVVVVESHLKKVQHPTGGIVSEIYVKNGDRVEAGQLLLRLDQTLTRANLQMVSNQLDELRGREARLEAERDSANDVVIPATLATRTADPQVDKIVTGEQRLFRSRRESRESQISQLRQRIVQLDQEFVGISGQIGSKEREIELIGKQIKDVETLEEKQLVTTAKMVALRRETARLEGEHGLLTASAAQTVGKKSEVELEILRIDQEMRTEVIKELRENQSRQAELVERQIAAEDQLRRIELRAPQSGIVHQLAFHTVGGVINGGEPILLIVPDSDKLLIEAKINPHDIDQALSSRSALIRFAAFNQRTTPEVTGQIRSVSADLTPDARTGETYYVARIEIPKAELARLESRQLVPGMPAEVHIKTHDRTALSYLLKPLEDQFARTFRER